jgi:hypothetical protein
MRKLDLVGMAKILDHLRVFLLAVLVKYGNKAFFFPEMLEHTICIGFRVELYPDYLWRKSNGHDRPLIRDVRTNLFQRKDLCSQASRDGLHRAVLPANHGNQLCRKDWVVT